MLAAGKKFAELAGRRQRPQQQNTQPVFFPPQQGGVNAVSGAATAPIQDALLMYNMIPAEFGATVRLGYVEHCEPVPDGTGIRTLIPVEPQSAVMAKKMFAVTNDGIYDVTVAAGTPVKVLDFTIKGDPAGYCTWTNLTNVAGQFLLVCDEANGYYFYDVDAETWTKVLMGAGANQVESANVATMGIADPEDFQFVMVWKHRVWFIDVDSGKGWFLPAGQITGAVTAFQFGNKFKHGGHLKGLYNWTLDGGEGVDDYMMALSSAGDMLVYKGTDPATTDFVLHGSWFIGLLPEGRRMAEDTGGDMFVLSTYGLIQPSKLIAGLPLTDEQTAISYKINPRINEVLSRSITFTGWQVKSDPKNQLLFVISPKELDRYPMQFVYNTATKGWAQFIGLPIRCAEVWDGQLYFGTVDNQVFAYRGHVDNSLLIDEGASATAIEWEVLTTFQSFKQPARFKRVQFMRPMFIATSAPSYLIAARYDFDMSQLPGSPSYVAPAGGLWDVGLWDVAVWGGGYIVNQPPYGGFGMGRYVAISIRGRSSSDTIHVGTDVLFDAGGVI